MADSDEVELPVLMNCHGMMMTLMHEKLSMIRSVRHCEALFKVSLQNTVL